MPDTCLYYTISFIRHIIHQNEKRNVQKNNRVNKEIRVQEIIKKINIR